MARRSRRERRSHTRLGVLFRRANRWQKAVAVVCALVAVHGVYVLFVPGVALDEEELGCPPAVAAAVAGKGGVPTPDGVDAAAHDAACAVTGRWWVLAAGGQAVLAVLWGLVVLEWGRVWRRARRRRRKSSGASRSGASRSGSARSGLSRSGPSRSGPSRSGSSGGRPSGSGSA